MIFYDSLGALLSFVIVFFSPIPFLISPSNAPRSFVLLGAMVIQKLMDLLTRVYINMLTFLFAGRRCGWLRRLYSGRGWFSSSGYIRC